MSGHQICLFCGPLSTLHKIISILAYARKYHRKAIFWMETNDSDFEEINQLIYIQNQSLIKKKWNKKTSGQRIGSIKMDKNLQIIVQDYFKDHQSYHISKADQAMVEKAYQIGNKLEDANELLLNYFFADYPVDFFNPVQKEFIDFSQTYLRRELATTKEGEQFNGFLLQKDKRQAIFKKGNGWIDRKNKIVRVNEDGTYLVPNLQTRSVIQDAWFNSPIYLAGPGEMKYLSTLSNQYQKHQVSAGTFIPRGGGYLIPFEKKLSKRLIKNYQKNQSLNQLFLNMENKNFAKLLAFKNEIKKMPHFFPYQKAIFSGLGNYRRELLNNNNKKFENYQNLFYWYFPLGKSQERVFTTLDFLLKFGGKNLIEKMLRQHKRVSNHYYYLGYSKKYRGS